MLLTATTVGRPVGVGSWVRVQLGSHFNSIGLVVDVEYSLLYLLVYLLGRVDEGLLHIGGSLGRGLHEHQPVLPREALPLLLLHVPPRLQVTFIADEHDDHVGTGMLSEIVQPLRQVIEGVASGDVVYEEGPSGASVVRAGDRAESFLASSIPDLEFDLFTVNADHSSSEFNAYCEIMYRLEAFIRELQQQA